MGKFADVLEDAKKIPVLAKAAAFGGGMVGMSLGKGFPDIDINLMGIGAHRNWFTHSAATSAILYMATKWYLKKLNAGNNSEFQEKLLRYVGAPIMATFSVANAAHLLADMLGAKDVVGWPVSILLRGGMWKDRIWLGVNAVGCLVLSWEFIKITISDNGQTITAEKKR